jgi:hypothetical protein
VLSSCLRDLLLLLLLLLRLGQRWRCCVRWASWSGALI